MKKLKIGKNDNFTSNNVSAFDEKHNKKTQCVILNKDRSCDIVYVKGDDFHHRGNYYYIYESGVYITKKGNRIVTFLEGVSLPLSHQQLEYEDKDFKYFDPSTGQLQKGKIKTVKGIKFDSKVFEKIVDGKLVDVITRGTSDAKSIITIILLVVTAIGSIGGLAMWFIGR